jgi:hypothetical protein
MFEQPERVDWIVPALFAGNHAFVASARSPDTMAGFSTQGGSMAKILAFSGSIRRDSWNRKLIQVAVDATRAAGGNVTRTTWQTSRCRSTTAISNTATACPTMRCA